MLRAMKASSSEYVPDADETSAASGFGIRRSQNGQGSQGAEIFSFALTQRPCGHPDIRAAQA
jgi:hypothetical protein